MSNANELSAYFVRSAVGSSWEVEAICSLEEHGFDVETGRNGNPIKEFMSVQGYNYYQFPYDGIVYAECDDDNSLDRQTMISDLHGSGQADAIAVVSFGIGSVRQLSVADYLLGDVVLPTPQRYARFLGPILRSVVEEKRGVLIGASPETAGHEPTSSPYLFLKPSRLNSN